LLRALTHERAKPLMCARDGGDERSRVREGVENPSLRLRIKERLRVVLSVNVDERPPKLREHAGRHRRSIRPRTRACASDLTLQHDGTIVDIDAALVEQCTHVLTAAEIEHALDHGAFSTGAHE